jgi:hypothetical protein
MYKPMRFELEGEEHGVPVRTLFKSKNAALRYAERLKNWSLRDKQTNSFIAGTNPTIQDILNDTKKETASV